MTVLYVKTEIAFNELLNVVKQLDTVELEKLTAEAKTVNPPVNDGELKPPSI